MNQLAEKPGNADINSVSVLVLIPVFNAADYLPDLIPAICKFVCPDNILFINDGSTDNTADIIKKSGLKYLSYPENRGKGTALKAGFSYAIDCGYRSVLTIDADLQHLPDEIPGFYAKDNSHQVIIGTRDINLRNMPMHRWLSNRLTSLIVSIFARKGIHDSQSGFRLTPVELLKVLNLTSRKFDLESEILFKTAMVGYPVKEIPISTVYRNSSSHIHHAGDTARFVKQVWKRIWA